ncbi:uncharacterized protein VTP21DRAFT_7995 [Calcarisporiella thermophila]|uniref:uncharacterized protein n=1 Tax=Calcarisporiella thermophila TaxID=911321 RepID=UPI003742B737
MTQRNILVVGTGAVGGLYAWRLSVAGARVTTVCRSNYGQVKQEGFLIKSEKWGDAQWTPDNVVKSVKELDTEPDLILVTLKALPDVYSIPTMIKPAVVEGKTRIVLAQNGLGVETPILKHFPKNPIISSVLYVAATQQNNGIVQTGTEKFKVGVCPQPEMDSALQKAALHETVELLVAGGVDAQIEEDIQAARWEKTIWNASFSGVQLLAGGIDSKSVWSSPDLCRLVDRMVEDGVRASVVAGHPIPLKVMHRVKELARNIVKDDFKSSIVLDYERGKPLETEVIFGEMLRAAKQRDPEIQLPYLETFYTLTSSLQRKNRESD